MVVGGTRSLQIANSPCKQGERNSRLAIGPRGPIGSHVAGRARTSLNDADARPRAADMMRSPPQRSLHRPAGWERHPHRICDSWRRSAMARISRTSAHTSGAARHSMDVLGSGTSLGQLLTVCRTKDGVDEPIMRVLVKNYAAAQNAPSGQ